MADYPTTDGDLALANLDSQIAGQEIVRAANKQVETNAPLVGLLLLHGQVTGQIADYERAEKLADELVKAVPKSPVAWTTHGSVMSTLHRFDEALSDYARAEKVGEKPVELVAPRMSIDAARGKDVLAYRELMAKQLPNLTTLGALAVQKADLGDIAAAEALFGDAQDSYRNVSPMPVAMLYFQNGLVAQREGSLSRARDLFRAAHERLPAYAQATSHLAAVLAATGSREEAIALLTPLAQKSDDPEYAGELARALDDAKRTTEAAAMRQRAAVRFDALIKKHPLAFADHAARFYLGSGEPKRALELALLNRKNRPTPEAMRLVIDAAILAGDSKLACTEADALLARPSVPARNRIAAGKAYFACNQKERGEREVALASAPQAKQ